MQIAPVSASSPVVNQVQTQPAPVDPNQAMNGAMVGGATINIVENNYINLSNGSVEILNQIYPAPGDTLNLTENNYVQDQGPGSSQAGPSQFTGTSGASLQQIEQQVGQYILQMMYQLFYGNNQSNTTSTSSSSSTGQLLNTLV